MGFVSLELRLRLHHLYLALFPCLNIAPPLKKLKLKIKRERERERERERKKESGFIYEAH
jgi:hypothetical protein